MSYTYTFNFDKMRIEHYIALTEALEKLDMKTVVEVISYLCPTNLYTLPISELSVVFYEFQQQYNAWITAQNFMSDFKSGWQMGLSDNEEDEE